MKPENQAHLRRQEQKELTKKYTEQFRSKNRDLGLSELRGVKCYDDDKQHIDALIDALAELRQVSGDTDVLFRIDNDSAARIVPESGIFVVIDGRRVLIPDSDAGIGPGTSFIFRRKDLTALKRKVRR